MKIPLYQLDAFADRLFAGNPAAVCPLDAWLPDETMQAIAAENNLSETAFLVARADGDGFDLRWFTPAKEADLCGHATLAAARVMFGLDPARDELAFHTRGGRLVVRNGGDALTMDFPAAPPQPVADAEAVATALRATPVSVHGAIYGMAVYDSADQVAALDPDLDAVARLPWDGTIATAPAAADDDADFVSRFFAPAAGIPEDPVTGSAHCMLVPFWSAQLAKSPVRGHQISARGGVVLGEHRADRVYLSGNVVPYSEGAILL